MSATTLLTATGYGRRVGLRVPAAEVDAARQWLPWWWQDEDVEPEQTWEAPDAPACEPIVRGLELWVAEHAVDRVFVHAGVVVVDGRAVLLPGRSHAGKSTLVLAMVRRGAAYASDEYAVVDAQGRVEPYPRRIALRDGERRDYRTPSHLGATTTTGPAPVALVAAVRYEEGSGAVRLSPQTRPAGLLTLLDNTIPAQTAPELAIDHLERATREAHFVIGTRGEAEACSDELFALLDEAADPPDSDRSLSAGGA